MKTDIINILLLVASVSSITITPRPEQTIITYGAMEFDYFPIQNPYFSLKGEPNFHQLGSESVTIKVPPARSPIVWYLSGRFLAPESGAYEFSIGTTILATIQVVNIEKHMLAANTKAEVIGTTPYKTQLQTGIVYDMILRYIGTLDLVEMSVKVPSGQSIDLQEFIRNQRVNNQSLLNIAGDPESSPSGPESSASTIDILEHPSNQVDSANIENGDDLNQDSTLSNGPDSPVPLATEIEHNQTNGIPLATLDNIRENYEHSRVTVEDSVTQNISSGADSLNSEVKSDVPVEAKDPINGSIAGNLDDQASLPAYDHTSKASSSTNGTSLEILKKREEGDDTAPEDKSTSTSTQSSNPGISYTVSVIKHPGDIKDVLEDPTTLDVFHSGFLDGSSPTKLFRIAVPTAVEVRGYLRAPVSGEYSLKIAEDAIGAIQIHGHGMPESDMSQIHYLDDAWTRVDTRAATKAKMNLESGKVYPFRVVLLNGRVDKFDWDINMLGPDEKSIDLFGLKEILSPNATQGTDESNSEPKEDQQGEPKDNASETTNSTATKIEKSADLSALKPVKHADMDNRTITFNMTANSRDASQPFEIRFMPTYQKITQHKEARDHGFAAQTSQNGPTSVSAAVSVFASGGNASQAGVWIHEKKKVPARTESSKQFELPPVNPIDRTSPQSIDHGYRLMLSAKANAESHVGVIGPAKHNSVQYNAVPIETLGMGGNGISVKLGTPEDSKINPNCGSNEYIMGNAHFSGNGIEDGHIENSFPDSFPRLKNSFHEDKTSPDAPLEVASGSRFAVPSSFKYESHKLNGPGGNVDLQSDEVFVTKSAESEILGKGVPNMASIAKLSSEGDLENNEQANYPFESDSEIVSDRWEMDADHGTKAIADKLDRAGGFGEVLPFTGDDKSPHPSTWLQDKEYEGAGSKLCFSWGWLVAVQLLAFQ